MSSVQGLPHRTQTNLVAALNAEDIKRRGPPPMEGNNKSSRRGQMVLVGLGASTVVLGLLCVPFLSVPSRTKLGRIPWMATPQRHITTALQFLPPPPQSGRGVWIDLGSGDGRLVIAAAKKGYKAVGYELNWVLVAASYVNALRAGVLDRVSFRHTDFWSADLSNVDVVSCFGVQSIMSRLFEKVMTPHSGPQNVVLFRFSFDHPRAAAMLTHSADELFIYDMKKGKQ